MTSAHWEVITVMLWGPDISAEIFRYPTTKNCVRAFTFKVRASFQGSFRCEKKRCNLGEILDEEGYCIRLECGAGFEPDPSGSCIVRAIEMKLLCYVVTLVSH